MGEEVTWIREGKNHESKNDDQSGGTAPLFGSRHLRPRPSLMELPGGSRPAST